MNIMKTPYYYILLLAILASCKSKEEIDPNSLVNKWLSTGQMQSKKADGTWSDWYVPQTFAAVIPSVWEFTKKGDFLRDGKPGGDCCFVGNKYSLSDNVITFSDPKNCPTVDCGFICNTLKIEQLKNDTLVLMQCSTKNQFVRVK